MASRSNSTASSASGHSSEHFLESDKLGMDRDSHGLEPVFVWAAERGPDDPWQPDINIVHVEAAASGGELLVTENTLLTHNVRKRSLRRDWIFRADVSCLLNEEYTHTLNAIDFEARRLLEQLKHLQQENSKPRTAVIFVAYDLGSLIVKKALAIARYEDDWASIFTSTARLVFCGCFQRGADSSLLERSMFEFLLAVSKDTWATLLTSLAARNLAMAVEELNETFLASKITLRCRMFSLFASEPEGKWVKKYFTQPLATIGIATELMVQEEAENEDNGFPSLAVNISNAVRDWIAEPSKTAMEVTLMSLVSPDRRMVSGSQASKPGHLNLALGYSTWLGGNGLRVLHVHSPSAIGAAEVAEHIGHEFVLRNQAIGIHSERPFAFDFAMANPTREPVQNMMMASFLHYFAFACNPDSTSDNEWSNLLQDQFELHNAWTEDDARNLFDIFPARLSGNLFLLYGLDHCPHASRAVLWSLLADMAARSEESWRFVLTSGDTNFLSSEMSDKGIHYTECLLPHEDPYAELDTLDGDVNLEAMVLRLSPRGQGRFQIRQALLRALPMQCSVLENYISFIERRSCWPKTASKSNLSLFCALLEALPTNRNPGAILSRLLRAVEDQEQTMLALSWILCGYRPLSPLELAGIVWHTRRAQSADQTTYPLETTPREVLQNIRSTLGSFVDLSSFQVREYDDVSKLMDGDEDYIWGRARATAPQLILDFLLAYLRSPDVQERLQALYHQYEAKVKAAGQNITPPMEQTGEDILFYSVQALPHHLSGAELDLDTQSLLKDPLGPYSAWARLYWAMSNPFSRPSGGPYLSAWETWRMVSSGPANMIGIREISNGHDDMTEVEEGSNRDLAEISIMADLQNAVRANNKDMAVNLAHQLVENHQSLPQDHSQCIQWPPSILWRATWLDMVELVDLLLNNGVQADDSASAYSPSPLYLAASLGLGQLVEVFLSHGADFTVKRKPSLVSPMIVAAANGLVDVVKTLLRHKPCLMEEASPTTPLYDACYYGAFKVVETLLEMGADVDQPGTTLERANDMESPNWINPPLVVACEEGHVNIVRLLLDHGAKVNAPARFDTAISWAAIDGHSVECVRLLLQHGADPNHELLEPPLLTQIIQERLIPDEDKVAMFDMLVNNVPPVLIDKADTYDGMTPLMEAALKGDVTTVRWLLEHGANTRLVDNSNRHALYYAVKVKSRPVVEEILKHQPLENRNIVASDGSTVLGHSLDNVPLLRLLLDAELDPELEFGAKQTILNVAVAEQKVEVVKLLLERNVDVHHRDEQGWSPILDATGFRPNPEITRLLLEHGADPQDSTFSKSNAVHQATRNCRPDVLRILLEFRIALDLDARNVDDDTPLSLAYDDEITEEGKECIKLLIRAGADVNYARNEDGLTLLMIAAMAVTRDPKLDDILLAAPKIDVNAVSSRYGTALVVACRSANFNLAVKLMDRGADVNFCAQVWGSTPIMAVCLPDLYPSQRVDIDDFFSRSEQMIRELIYRGADVNLGHGFFFYNTLSAAALMGGTNVINYLLDKGASVSKRDPLGRQAMHFSAANGLRNFEALCLATDGDIRAPDDFGKNVLHWAAQFGHVKTIQSIMRRLSFLPARDRREFVNSRDADGWTPLAWASRPVIADLWMCAGWTLSEEQNHAATIQLLIEEGGDPAVEFQVGPDPSSETLTAWKMAKRCQLDLPEEILRMLKPKANTERTGSTGDNQETAEGQTEETRSYVRRTCICNICLSNVFGIAYECKTCINFGVCSKCYTRIEQYHKPFMDLQGETGNATHEFQVIDRYKDEFESPSESSSPVESIVGGKPVEKGSPNANQVANGGDDGPGQKGLGTYADDSIDGLHLSDLSDLEEESMLDGLDI